MAIVYWGDLSNGYKASLRETVSSMLKLQLFWSEVWLMDVLEIAKKEEICAKERDMITAKVNWKLQRTSLGEGEVQRDGLKKSSGNDDVIYVVGVIEFWHWMQAVSLRIVLKYLPISFW